MEYTYQQVQELVQISRTSFFTRLNFLKPEIEQYITKKDGVNYISDKGIELLRNYKKNDTEKSSEKEKELLELQDKVRKMAEESAAMKERLNEKNHQQEILERQLLEQSQNINFSQEQLREKDDQIKKLTSLVENGQILLGQAQEQVKLLSAPEEIVQGPQTVQKNGIWQKIFGK